MAFTDYYVDSASSGGDGTTNATSGTHAAWATMAAAITGIGVGPAASSTRINVKAGTYNSANVALAFSTAGATTAPVWWRGYKTTIGDQDSNNVAVAGTDIPLITFSGGSTGQFQVSAAHQIFSSLAVTNSCTTTNGTVYVTGANCKFYRFRSSGTAANSSCTAFKCSSAGTQTEIVACYLTANALANVLTNAGASLIITGTEFVAGLIGVSTTSGPTLLFSNVFDSQAGDAVFSNGSIVSMIGCSVYAPAGNGINVASIAANQPHIIVNNYFENVNQASKAGINNTTGTNTNYITCIANAYYNCTSTVLGLGDSPLIFDNGTLGSAGFVAPASHIFAINTIAQQIGFPGVLENFENNANLYTGYQSVGAVQPTSSGCTAPFGSGALITL